MKKARRRGRSVVALGLVLPGLLLVCPYAFALDPALDVSQYAHTAWKIRDGFSKGYINSIAQMPDGYLWLGTEFGLLRFDGVRAVPWQPPADQRLPSTEIFNLLATRDGSLWIGTSKGLASWKDGKLTQYKELAGQAIFKLLEDHEGSVWVGAWGVPTGRLCMIRNGTAQCHGEDGSLGTAVFGLYEDSKGNLWAGVATGLWRWKPGPPKFYPLPGAPNGIQGLAEDDDGALFIGLGGGIKRFVDGKIETYILPGVTRKFEGYRLLRDRDGDLWIGTSFGGGLIHVHRGRIDMFAQSGGLSGSDISTLFEDREGTIWVATTNGLDRFRDFAVATFSVNQGLSNAAVGSVLADRDGSVWLGTDGALNHWKNGEITIPRTGSGKRDGKLSGHSPHSLFQDDHGRIWVSTAAGVGYLEDNRFVPIREVPGGFVPSIAEDTDGSLWIANPDQGLFQVLQGHVVRQIPWAKLGRKDYAAVLAADPLQGGLWIGFFLGGAAYLKDGQVRVLYSAADGMGEGRVNQLRLEPDGTLWAATEGGLSRLKNGRVATLTTKNELPCDAIYWAMEDDNHSFWLYTACGLVRIARGEIDDWAAAVDKSKDAKRTIHATVFDSSDGVRSSAYAVGYSPLAAKSPDGKLWFTGLDGVSVVDPRHLSFNKLPPPVHIEQIIADHKVYDLAMDGTAGKTRLRLPALIRDLEIDYTALSLVAPEKVQFRYKLEGRDRDWQDAGTRRQAFYTDLAPRNYRFRVVACNNSGMWNEAGTFLDFSVAPAYYQTTRFRLSCMAAFLVLFGALYQLRLRQMAQQFNMRMDERVNERTRIARELHDTLLQSFQGLLLRFQAATNLLPPGEAKEKFECAIDQAAQAITEGRDAVQGLRSSTTVTNDLACAITTLGEELASGETNANAAEFHVAVEGTSRNLHPILRDEVYRIAGEALRNAFKHAQAQRIEVEIRYDERQLRLRVRDDGKGIDAKHVNEDGRPGHYGLGGMRERAKLMGGKLAVWSELDSGTEVELRIPALRAYATSSSRGLSWLAEKFAGKDV